MSAAVRFVSADRRKKPCAAWGRLGPALLAVGLCILAADACDPPRFETMKIKGGSKLNYAPDERVEYECRLGYKKKIPSNMVSVCYANNSWSLLQEGCTKKACGNPGELINGIIDQSEGFELGATITFSCEEGFNLVGKKSLICEIGQDSVNWNGNLPQCEKAMCEPPPDIENGIYSNAGKDVYEYGEVVRYSCNPVRGADQYSLVGAEILSCSTNAEWSSEPPKCKVVKCEYPIVVNGEMVGGHQRKYYYKAKVKFECLKGFSMTGNNIITCEENNKWNPPVPVCLKVSATASTKSTILARPDASTTTTRRPDQTSLSGTTSFTEVPPASNILGGGSITVIVVAIAIGVTVFFIFLYKYLNKNKSGAYVIDESHREVKFISL
ncbi:membrane cofactor protein isoform X2 [Tenrec ecaudatus]|uniref:membrane cofactor protein isoform X2 n=1 Tax=Tenrec ecaudatus TaxID=94439 RepID=UPI003F5A38F6